MTYDIRPASPPPAKFTRRGRPGGAANIHQIQIHATRGETTLGWQVQATEDWFAHGPARGGWGASADFVVGPDDRVGGKMVIVSFGDYLRTFSSWSAGYGPLGAAQEWGAAEVGVAIEVAQPDNDTPFTAATVDAVAWLCGQINLGIARAGGSPVPPTHITAWDQLRNAPIPRGYIGHDELANGVRSGKSDPGKMWDWPGFLAKLAPERKPPPIGRWQLVKALVDNRVTTLPLEYRGIDATYTTIVRKK